MSKWISFASVIKNETYIEKLLSKYKIENYRFAVNGYGDYDLYVAYKLGTYKVSIDERNEQLIIYKKVVYRKAQKRRKEYFLPYGHIRGLDCWLKAIKLIMTD